jgi:hypothetical protein
MEEEKNLKSLKDLMQEKSLIKTPQDYRKEMKKFLFLFSKEMQTTRFNFMTILSDKRRESS